MGIILGFVLVCLVIYAVLVTNGIFILCKLILFQGFGLTISAKILWAVINVALWGIAFRFIYSLLQDSKGSTPDMEGVWKFYLIINTVLFLVVFLLGYKSK